MSDQEAEVNSVSDVTRSPAKAIRGHLASVCAACSSEGADRPGRASCCDFRHRVMRSGFATNGRATAIKLPAFVLDLRCPALEIVAARDVENTEQQPAALSTNILFWRWRC